MVSVAKPLLDRHLAVPVQEPDPRVGAVILTYNRLHEVLHTVDSKVALPGQPEIVVVDNASSDGTSGAIAERFPSVRCLRLSKNLGAAGRNAGVHACERRYIALCDDDTWWETGSLCEAANLLDAHPKVAIVTGKVVVGDTSRIAPACLEMAASPLERPDGLPGPALLGFHAGAALVRRSAFLACGGFEERYFLGGEEELLALNLASAGWQIAYADHVVVHHYPSISRDVEGRRRLVLRNALWTAWLRRPLRHALRRTVKLARQARRDPAARIALLQALRGLPWALRHRRPVPEPVERRLRLLEYSAAGR